MLMDANNQLRQMIESKYLDLQSKNKSYSQGAFAKKLGISSGALSEILARKRKVTFEKAMQICEKLEVSTEQIARLKEMYAKEKKLIELSRIKNDNFDYTIVEKKYFDLFFDWRFLSIACLLRINPKCTIESISNRLSISTLEVESIIEQSLSVGLIQKTEQGLQVINQIMRSSESPPENLLYQRIRETVTTALDLANNSPESLLNMHATLRVDPNRIPEAKLMMENFLKQLCIFLSSGDCSEVYDFHMNFFSRTK